MARKNHYIVSEVAAILGSDPEYVRTLLREKKIKGHKCASNKWLIPKDQEEVFDTYKLTDDDEAVVTEQDNDPKEPFVRYIADEKHYTEVFARMNKVKHSLKLTSANLKKFDVYFEKDAKEDPIKFGDFLLILLNRGVKVQIVCMNPFGFFDYCRENLPSLIVHPGLDLRQNDSIHMKVFIFDDECAYIGSANLTGAAIGRRSKNKRNHEAGILVQNNDVFESASAHFERVWNDQDTIKSSWRRFENKLKAYKKRFSR